MHEYELILKFHHINKGTEKRASKLCHQELIIITVGDPSPWLPITFSALVKAPADWITHFRYLEKMSYILAFLPKKSSILHSQAAIKHAANHSNLVYAGLDRPSSDTITIHHAAFVCHLKTVQG